MYFSKFIRALVFFLGGGLALSCTSSARISVNEGGEGFLVWRVSLNPLIGEQLVAQSSQMVDVLGSLFTGITGALSGDTFDGGEVPQKLPDPQELQKEILLFFQDQMMESFWDSPDVHYVHSEILSSGDIEFHIEFNKLDINTLWQGFEGYLLLQGEEMNDGIGTWETHWKKRESDASHQFTLILTPALSSPQMGQEEEPPEPLSFEQSMTFLQELDEKLADLLRSSLTTSSLTLDITFPGVILSHEGGQHLKEDTMRYVLYPKDLIYSLSPVTYSVIFA